MESLASYSALMFLEGTLGPKALEKTLDYYRTQLLAKGPDGATAGRAAPWWKADASKASPYRARPMPCSMARERGSSIDAAPPSGRCGYFIKMLAELRRRYEWKTVTTDQFRQLCAEFLPPGSPDAKLIDFFDQWVYDTGMPTLQLTYSVTGRKLTGTVTQTDAPEDFSVTVPVEIRSGTAKPIIKEVRTANGSVKFTVDVVPTGPKPYSIPAGVFSAANAIRSPRRKALYNPAARRHHRI